MLGTSENTTVLAATSSVLNIVERQIINSGMKVKLLCSDIFTNPLRRQYRIGCIAILIDGIKSNATYGIKENLAFRTNTTFLVVL
jgi:thiamine transporter ThiT